MDDTEQFGYIIESVLRGVVTAVRLTSRRKEKLSDLPVFTFLFNC